MQCPRQAVILAGGRGERLRPLTDTRPKPMIEFHGKPFLHYVIEMLRDQGFERILLLLGHLPHVVQHYFEDGRRLGVRIEYSVSAAENLTLRRLRIAEPLLDPCFLLLYCDNYWPLRMREMWKRFIEANVPAMVTVYTNKDGYSKDCVRVGQDGYVEAFDKTRTAPGLKGVEISYALLMKSVLSTLPEEDALVEQAVYPRLILARQLSAYLTDHRYYSVGSHERLPLTDAFFRRSPTVILDRDGVLNRRPPVAEYVRTPEEFEWLPGAKAALQLLHRSGYRVIVVSNQAGIGRGAMTDADVARIHERMKRKAEEAGGHVDAVYYCPHDWNAGCDCRKPRPGMLFHAQRDFHLDLTRTWFFGDDERDAQAAEAAGCPFALVTGEQPLLTLARSLADTRAVGATAWSGHLDG